MRTFYGVWKNYAQSKKGFLLAQKATLFNFKIMKEFASQLTDEREKIIWSKRLVNEDPVALAVLGKEFGVSRERVRQIEARLKTRLRNFLTQELGESLILDFTTED